MIVLYKFIREDRQKPLGSEREVVTQINVLPLQYFSGENSKKYYIVKNTVDAIYNSSHTLPAYADVKNIMG